jgi:ATP synthase protein I
VKNQSPQKQPNNYLKYSNLAIQMAVIIGLGCWGGYKLDQIYPNNYHIWAVVFSLVSIFAALYVVLKDLIKPKE